MVALTLVALVGGALAEPKRVVIVGGGYGGLEAARSLAREGVDVTLVDRSATHTMVTKLHRFVSSGEPIEVPFADIGRDEGFHFVRGDVTGINQTAKQVQLGSGRALDYDALVVAVGASTSWPAIPGLAEHAIGIRTIEEADRIRRTLSDRLSRAAAETDPQKQRQLARIVVAGAGSTGVEVAADIAESLPQLARKAGLPLGIASVALVARQSEVLGNFHPSDRAYAERRLRTLHVDVMKETSVSALTSDAVELTDARGAHSVGAGTVIWTGGVAAPGFLKSWGLPVASQGRVLVEPSLRVKGGSDIWSIGDAAAAIDLKTGETAPMTAQHAVQQGKAVAENILRQFRGKAQIAYQPKNAGELVSLGSHDAVGRVFGIPVRGRAATLVRSAIQLRHEASLRRGGVIGRYWRGSPARPAPVVRALVPAR